MQNFGVSDAARRLAVSVREAKDSLLRDAISKRINTENWTIEDVVGRIVKVENIGPHGGEIFLMDGVPILEILPNSPEINCDIVSGIEKKTLNYQICYRME